MRSREWHGEPVYVSTVLSDSRPWAGTRLEAEGAAPLALPARLCRAIAVVAQGLFWAVTPLLVWGLVETPFPRPWTGGAAALGVVCLLAAVLLLLIGAPIAALEIALRGRGNWRGARDGTRRRRAGLALAG